MSRAIKLEVASLTTRFFLDQYLFAPKPLGLTCGAEDCIHILWKIWYHRVVTIL